MSQVEQEFDLAEDLDPQVQRDMESLIHQKALAEGFQFGGHSFVIRTLNASERWAAYAAARPYQGSIVEPQVVMAAIVGSAIVVYDNDTNFHIKLDDRITHASKRLDYVGEWDEIVIEACFSKYNELDKRRIVARQAMGNLSPTNLTSFMHTPDS